VGAEPCGALGHCGNEFTANIWYILAVIWEFPNGVTAAQLQNRDVKQLWIMLKMIILT